MEETGNFGETYVMMYALETLHNRGITVKETVYESIHNLNQWYEQSGNYKYLELALLHMQRMPIWDLLWMRLICPYRKYWNIQERQKTIFFQEETALEKESGLTERRYAA